MAEMESNQRSLDKEVKNMIGRSVSSVCQLDFKILREDDGFYSGEGRCQSLCEPLSEAVIWMKGITIYSVIQAGNLGFNFKFSLSFTSPCNPGAHSQRLFVQQLQTSSGRRSLAECWVQGCSMQPGRTGEALALPFLAVSLWASDLHIMLHFPCL